ncbi:galactose mutarotase-like domain-containing protein [Mycena maculata]|uniref:Galactose mutarotase-like domain-containing protein n=1 Tax=Mycena maculata TaxID=230809 RepID=A0AAD7JHP6_9AGAR|nr:galactose mutarotase-like domain-containing protein [Mycena maculata]
MFSKSLILAALLLNAGASLVARTGDPFAPVKLAAPDGSVIAHFMPFGATTTNFWVKDKFGKFRDIILGFDNHTLYQTQADGHPYFGPIVGRYANRIRNGTFTIPISKDASGPGKKYQITENENNGTDTLHGGIIGYDQRPWTIVKQSSNSVTFSLLDPNGDQGFPGTVTTTVEYTLESKATWKISMQSVAEALTPIMLSGHHYWNLEAYQETQDLSGHFAQFDASRIIATDGALIPNGNLTPTAGTPLDFSKAKSLGAAINATAGDQFCGTDCIGFDNCWIYDDNNEKDPVFSLWSVNSGIKLEVTTNQPALQVYTCNGIFNPDLPIPRKVDQGGPDTVYADHSCLVVEQESWIDAINNPNFGINQIYGPGRTFNWESSYVFSVLK